MHKDRMELLVRVLDGIEAKGKRFNMGTWFDPPEDGISCGTTACALGWAALDPRFHELGLCMGVSCDENGEEHSYRCTTIEQICLHGDARSIDVTPVWEDFMGYDAAIMLFDISEKAAHYIFDPSRYYEPSRYLGLYPTIAAVRDRVVEVIELNDLSPREIEEDTDEVVEDDQATPTVGFV